MCYFKIFFSLFLVFNSLIMMCLGLVLSLSCLGVAQLKSLTKFGKFLVIASSNIFSAPTSFSFPSGI